MAFEKKILVLKQLEKGYSLPNKTVSGIARIETENGVSEFYLSLINLTPAPHGEYYVFILDGNKKLFSFFMGKYPEFAVKTLASPPNASNISVGISAVDNYIPILVAFATTEPNGESLKEFKKAVADHLAQKHREERKKEEKSERKIPPQEDSKSSTTSSATSKIVDYNDEAVATENYFEFDDLESKLNKIKELDNEYIQFENELSNNNRKKETQESTAHGFSFEDEADKRESKDHSQNHPYFLSVRGELEEIFQKFPKETELTKTFSESRWAKVYYSDTKYYVVGLIFEEHKEKYICYGVPGSYSSEPPKELKGFCSFIPLSIFSLLGDGYWMMFQDAITGECIKPK